MAKSRLAAALAGIAACGIPLPSAAVAGAEPLTAEQAILNLKYQLRAAAGIGCPEPKPDEGGDIVVCGRAAERPVFPEDPGRRPRLIAGEAPSGGAALAATAGPSRGRGLDVLKMGRALASGLRKIF